MRELAKSMVSLPWAASLFGVQQLGKLVSAGGTRKSQERFYTVTQAIQEQFAANPLWFGAYQIVDEVQKGAVDLFWDVVKLQVFSPEWIGRTTESLVQRSADAARALTPGKNLTLLIDTIRNTFDVIGLVNRASGMLDLPPGPIRLNEALGRAYSFGNYSPLWLVEGLGEEYADRNSSHSVSVRGLLTTGEGANLPDKSLLMLHAGIGISFAKHMIRPLTPFSPRQNIGAALERFIELVQNNSRPGYWGPAFESLGLVTHTWYGQLVPIIDELLWKIDVNVLEYFWHGAGRAMYFTPLNLLPGTTAFHGVRSEAPHELARLSATAGAAWAFGLVNIRQPEILLNLLSNYSRMLTGDDAFTMGLASVVIMADDTLPGAPYTTALCDWTVPNAASMGATEWSRVVQTACRWAREYYPILKQQGLLGEIFRYHDLTKLAGQTEARSR